MWHPFRTLRLAQAAAVVCVGLAATGPSPAAASVTEAQASAAAARGARWIATQQEENGDLGSFGGDWSMTALAAAGINAADVRSAALDPSAQDFYLSQWTTEGPGGAATDDERAILTGSAGGLQTARLDVHTNLIADLAAQFDGHQLGGRGATNANAFGLLALEASGGPPAVMDALAQTLRAQQDADDGWNFAAGASSSDVDMTGAGIAALCAAGATAQDPAVARALTYLRASQDQATGGFVSAALGLNTDTTGWVTSGLRRCGIDPRSWITSEGKTPVDFLISQQNPDGSFQWQAGDGNEDLYATQDAVRPLAGAAFTASAPPRALPGEPAVRPAPVVADGTPVPMTLIIDSGTEVSGGSSVRMCKVLAETGASVARLLQNAHLASEPSYCVSDLELSHGRIARLNGVAAVPGRSSWQVSREAGAPEAETGGGLGLGARVEVQLSGPGEAMAEAPQAPGGNGGGAGTAPSPSSSLAAAQRRLPPARLGLRVPSLTRLIAGRLTVRLSCPQGTGLEGCRGLLRVRVTLRRGRTARPCVVASNEVHLRAGSTSTVTVVLDAAARRSIHERPNRVAWLVAAMRDPGSGAVTSSVASTVLR
jgi:hypothetical protein